MPLNLNYSQRFHQTEGFHFYKNENKTEKRAYCHKSSRSEL